MICESDAATSNVGHDDVERVESMSKGGSKEQKLVDVLAMVVLRKIRAAFPPYRSSSQLECRNVRWM